jgi:hypothetical protein
VAGPNSPDVVPVRDLRNMGSPIFPPLAFERVVPPFPTTPPTASYSGHLAAYEQNQYVCSWGTESTDPLPKMIRITFALDDPNGRVSAPQFFEYVIDLTQ